MPTSSPGTVPAEVRSPFAPDLPLRTTPEWHLARRASMGADAALVSQIRKAGVHAWLEAQLSPQSIPDPDWDAFENLRLPWLRLDYPALLQRSGQRQIQIGGALCQGLVHRPVLTKRVLWESVVTFWGDHLYIPWRSKAAAHVIGFDREVIRKHTFGRFEDMLLAALHSPALLHYLDNVENVARKPNENLGRELLELYTVGRGAYVEDDISQSSAILSGMGVDPVSGAYRFTGANHRWGPVKVMGFNHPNPQVPVQPGDAPAVVRAYVHYLATHPSTADRIARKLLRRFVSDRPSEDFVRVVAKAYLDSGTAVVPMLRIIFNHPEFWGSVGQKWARPREVLTAARRAAGQRGFTPPASLEQDSWAMGGTAWSYDKAGDMPRDWPMVDGYPDDARAWMGNSTMLATWNAVAGVTLRWDDGAPPVDWAAQLGVSVGQRPVDVARRITLALTGYVWAEQHIASVASMLANLGAPANLATVTLNRDHLRWNLPEAVHLVLSSPYAFLR